MFSAILPRSHHRFIRRILPSPIPATKTPATPWTRVLGRITRPIPIPIMTHARTVLTREIQDSVRGETDERGTIVESYFNFARSVRA
jgi:hypothetical protein